MSRGRREPREPANLFHHGIMISEIWTWNPLSRIGRPTGRTAGRVRREVGENFHVGKDRCLGVKDLDMIVRGKWPMSTPAIGKRTCSPSWCSVGNDTITMLPTRRNTADGGEKSLLCRQNMIGVTSWGKSVRKVVNAVLTAPTRLIWGTVGQQN